MTNIQHKGTFEDCTYCQRYIRLGYSFSNKSGKRYTATTRRLHRVAINRRERDSVLKDMGLTKVKGNLGGTYWE